MNPSIIIVTSSGTPDKLNLSAKHFHRLAVKAGFSSCEHHYIITRDGKSHQTRPMDSVGASLLGPENKQLKKHNRDALSILLVGTRDYTVAQLDTLWAILYVFISEGLTNIVSHSQLCKETSMEDSGKPGFNLNDFITERLVEYDHA